MDLFRDVIAARLSRRAALRGLGAGAVAFLGCGGKSTPGGANGPLLGFTPVPIARGDDVVVPSGYTWHVVNAWGDPIMPGAPEFAPDASQTAAEQAMQAGMFHDGMEFFPLPKGSNSADHGLMAINFEYTDDNLLHPEGMASWTAAKVARSQAAHGLGVYELKLDKGIWKTVKDSPYGRRITGATPIALRGPAAGHDWMKTAADPEGRTAIGTWNNCACGRTPWGTYLACEENVTPYFVDNSTIPSLLHDRYGVLQENSGWGFRWHEFDERFDAQKHPNEPNRHGWVLEIDPFDPASPPVKHTGMGRLAHEGVAITLASDGRVVGYMGDDDFRWMFEHIYKYVSRRPYVPGSGPADNQDMLDDGTLYVARFDEDGTGEWVPLVAGERGLVPDAGFTSQAEILINARKAADVVGATFMDRPEWLVVHPKTGEVYASLTYNTGRGALKPSQQPEVAPADKPNPRAPNPVGHIIRWREQGGDPAATRFEWDIFLLAGDPEHPDPVYRGNVKGGVAFACPDGLAFDHRGVLWIETDAPAIQMASPDWVRLGNNQLLAADPVTGEVRRFLTGPVGCEVTGIQFAPDMRTLFVNIQHPGEPPKPHPPRSDPKHPKAISSWPDRDAGGRPRSATIAIRRKDGGIVGT